MARRAPGSPFEEVRQQNLELLQALEEVQQRRDQLLQLNCELEDTNRGVVALYAELDEKAGDLRRASEMKSRFLSNMSHEFRTPLNSIRSRGGLGIGLTLVKSLVELHGGTVEAHSDGPRHGSEFCVRLPLALTLAGDARALPATSSESATPQRRILIVDDNRNAAQSMADVLRLMGHAVATAHDGPAALALAPTFLPAVILLDIGLPGMTGYEISRRFRQQPGLENAFIVALTGFGTEDDRRKTQQAGMDAHLVKPVEWDALKELLDRHRRF